MAHTKQYSYRFAQEKINQISFLIQQVNETLSYLINLEDHTIKKLIDL